MRNLLLLIVAVFCLSFNVFAQPPVDIYQVVAPTNPMNCTNTTLTITGWNDAGNYSLQSITHFYGNDTIWIDIKYTSPQIVIGVLTPWTHYVSLGNVPYGNWVVVARGYLGGVWQSEANGWLPVDACCPSSIPQFDFVEDTVCAGSSISVTNNSIGNNLSYFWEYEGGTSTAAAPTFSISEGGEYDVTLTVTGDSCSDSLVKTIEVLDLPLVELGNDTAICDGDSLELSLPAGNDYLWSDGSISYQNIIGTVGSLAVTVTNDDGCSKSDTIEVSAVLPNVPVNLGPDKTVCPDESVTLNAGTGGSFYAWSTGETTQTISVNQEGSVFVTVSESGSCDGVDEIVINWHSVDEAEIMLSADSCQERLIWLDPSTHQVIQWSDTSSDTAMLVTTPGYYFVTAEDNNGCETADSTWVNIVNNPVFSLGNDTFLCGNQTITLTTGISGDHLWKDGSTGIGFTVTKKGTYYVFVTDEYGCTGSDTIKVSDCLNISDAHNNGFEVYPVPASQAISVIGMKNRSFQITDVRGMVVKSGVLYEEVLNIEMLDNGLYHLTIDADHGLTKTFIKN